MNDRTAVVTDATTALGEAVASEFAAGGATVVVAGRDAEDVSAAVETTGAAAGLRTDVRDEYDVERLLETAARTGPAGVDVVVPNAAVYHGPVGETPLSGTSYAAFDDTIRTNARGVFATVSEALPHLSAEARVLVPTGPTGPAVGGQFGPFDVARAATEAIARGFASNCEQTVGCLDLGRPVVEFDADDGPDPASVAPSFRWAATDLPAAELDGSVVSIADRQDAAAE